MPGNGSIVGRDKNNLFLRHKKKIIALLTIIIAVSISLLLLRRQHQPPVKQSICYKQIPKARQLLEKPKGRALLDLGLQIEKIPGYKTDVDCLYIITQGYISISDDIKSRESYKLLVGVYDEKVGYDKQFGGAVTRPDQLDNTIKFFEQRSKGKPEGSYLLEDK